MNHGYTSRDGMGSSTSDSVRGRIIPRRVSVLVRTNPGEPACFLRVRRQGDGPMRTSRWHAAVLLLCMSGIWMASQGLSWIQH